MMLMSLPVFSVECLLFWISGAASPEVQRLTSILLQSGGTIVPNVISNVSTCFLSVCSACFTDSHTFKLSPFPVRCIFNMQWENLLWGYPKSSVILWSDISSV